MNILLTQKRGIGDLMFGYAFYQSLAAKYPKAHIYWDVPENYASLLDYFKLKRVSNNIDNSTTCHSRENGNPVLARHSVVMDPPVKPEDDIVYYDLIIDLNKNIQTRNFTLHEVERYFLAHERLKLDITKAVYPLRKNTPKKNRLVISLGARISTRRWTVDNYLKLIKEFADKYEIVLVGGNDITPDAKEICEFYPKVINKTGILNLSQTCGELSLANYVIAMDSGVSHLCAALGIPVLVLTFNKVQNNFRWSPWTENCLVIRGTHNCKKICHSSECSENDCREALSAVEVSTAFKELVKGKRNGKNKIEMAKNSLFILFMQQDDLYNKLKAMGYQIFYYDKKTSLIKFILENNINLLVNPKINRISLWIKLLQASNYVSEYPLVFRSKENKPDIFLNLLLEKY